MFSVSAIASGQWTRSLARGLLVAATFLLASTACTERTISPRTVGGIVLGADTLAYRIYGRGGDTVVAVGGGPGLGSRYLEPLVARLGEDFTVIVYDPRGRGESSWSGDSSAFSLAGDAQDLNAVRLHFRLSTAHLLGHHYGAAVVTWFARRHPTRVRGLVLLTPYLASNQYIYNLSQGVPDSAELQRQAAALRADLARTDPDRFCREFWGQAFGPAQVTDPTTLAGVAPYVCGPGYRGWAFQDMVRDRITRSHGHVWRWGDSLRSVAARTLIIEGRPDGDPARQAGRRTAYLGHNNAVWASHLPDARVLTIRGEAWFPWVRDPTAVATPIREFLGGGWPAGARTIQSLDGADSVVTRFRVLAGE